MASSQGLYPDISTLTEPRWVLQGTPHLHEVLCCSARGNNLDFQRLGSSFLAQVVRQRVFVLTDCVFLVRDVEHPCPPQIFHGRMPRE